MTVSHAQILAAIQAIAADQQAVVDAAVAEQKRRDDLVIVGLQESLSAAAAQLLLDQDTLALDRKVIAELQARIAELEGDAGSGTLFGAFAGPARYPNDGETKAQMRARVCDELGVTRLPVERIFNEATFALPPPSPCVVSFTLDPSAVARGDFDTDLRGYVANLSAGVRYWLCLNHECDQSGRTYTAGQQVAGFRHFYAVVKDAARTAGRDVQVGPILMSWSIDHPNGKGSLAEDYWPGSDAADFAGFDAYARPNTTGADAEKVYGPCVDFATAHGKPLLICETSMGAVGQGGTGFTDDEWTQFVTDAVAYLEGKADAVTWFATNKSDGDWRMTNHPAALAVYAAAVQSSERSTP